LKLIFECSIFWYDEGIVKIFLFIIQILQSTNSKSLGRNWKQIYKALNLLEHLVKHGNERVIEEGRFFNFFDLSMSHHLCFTILIYYSYYVFIEITCTRYELWQILIIMKNPKIKVFDLFSHISSDLSHWPSYLSSLISFTISLNIPSHISSLNIISFSIIISYERIWGEGEIETINGIIKFKRWYPTTKIWGESERDEILDVRYILMI